MTSQEVYPFVAVVATKVNVGIPEALIRHGLGDSPDGELFQRGKSIDSDITPHEPHH
jgi:hypothetical protein